MLVGALHGDQRVAGLDVAMGQAPRMRGVERVGRAARPGRSRALAPSDPRAAAANRGRCPRRSASRCTAGRRSRRPRRSARCPRGRSTRPAATPPGTASESAHPRSRARPAASAPPCARDAGPRRDTPRPCRRDRGAPRSGNSPTGFRWREQTRATRTFLTGASPAYARRPARPIAPKPGTNQDGGSERSHPRRHPAKGVERCAPSSPPSSRAAILDPRPGRATSPSVRRISLTALLVSPPIRDDRSGTNERASKASSALATASTEASSLARKLPPGGARRADGAAGVATA